MKMWMQFNVMPWTSLSVKCLKTLRKDNIGTISNEMINC